MIERNVRLTDRFEAKSIIKVVKQMKPYINCKSKAIIAINLTNVYKTLDDNEKECMLNILSLINNGTYVKIIDYMNIPKKDKVMFLK
jgi:hypothetical protein